MEAGNFWNCSTKHTKESQDFFATRDTTKTPLTEISFAQNTKSKPVEVPQEVKDLHQKNISDNNREVETKDDLYCSDLVALNKSVLEWIKKHVNKNPCIDLTPVIRDYEKHLHQIGDKSKARVEEVQSKLTKTLEPTVHPSPVISAFGAGSVTFVSSTPIVGKMPSAGFFTPNSAALPAVAEEAKPVQAAKPSGENTAGEPIDAPPVVERKTIVEDDAFHQIRSKLFFKKGSAWQELGVGMLYLKPCGEKIQLLIRMEAVTGKILLNINVSKDLPVSRSGKNNVMVVSVPNPHVYLKEKDGDNTLPCTYLIRVKGTVEADELFQKLKATS